MKTKVLALLLTASVIITGCSSKDDNNTDSTKKQTEESTDKPTNKPGEDKDAAKKVEISKVNQLKLTDVNGYPLTGADVSIDTPSKSSAHQSSVESKNKLAPVKVDDKGIVTIDALGEGKYLLNITIGALSFQISIEIGSENYQAKTGVIAPVSLQEDGNATLVENAIISSISGTVIDVNNVPVANAQVSISGGSATNGAFATAVTDVNGAYTLLINVSDNLADALLESTITASAIGYTSQSKASFEVITNTNKSGINFALPAAAAQVAVYSDNFETGTENWTVKKLAGTNENNTWHVHTTSTVGVNKAYTANEVKLAPNDTSDGAIHTPLGQQCFWYGNGVQEDTTFGNFLGSQSSVSPLSGGSSIGSSGELISPLIDLTNETGNLKLSFDTYWEIESVNPNSSGFDVMTISVSEDDGVSWRNLAKLNPLSDPQTDITRAPIPFSNTGYNSAPAWLTQEAISLVDIDKKTLSGKNIRLKFTFNTRDGKYNGFRGWMIDNITITEGSGTFPLIEDLGSNTQTAPSFKVTR